MKVSHAADHITHAVIGGGEAIEFGISSSAEFFNILSSTLYTNQPLAVVREVLCNAWDAHIAAGRTDTPIEVSIKDQKLIVKDSGFGIAHEDMGRIYGTYGNSTKANDGKQTGGFGLGCKAPFAYVDHFEVTSSNGGFKSIYALSKSSAQTMGKPSIITIAKFPSQETGLTVTINLKSANDVDVFTKLIKAIAYGGDMLVNFNGERLSTIFFPPNKSYLVTTTPPNSANYGTELICVRYGNVIYPVKATQELDQQYLQVTKKLHSIFNGPYKKAHILFQAPPHSLSVTPSREHLSMQEKTLKTLKILMEDFLTEMNTKLEAEKEHVLHETNAEALKSKAFASYFSNEWAFSKKVEGSYDHFGDAKWATSEVAQLARISLGKSYPEAKDFRNKDLKSRVSLYLQEAGTDKKLIQSYMTELTKNPRSSQWLSKQIVLPFIKKLMRVNTESLNYKRLFVYGPIKFLDYQQRAMYTELCEAIPAHRASAKRIQHAFPFLRKILVLTYSKQRFGLRADLHPVLKEHGGIRNVLIYTVSRKKGSDEEARKFFQSFGYTIVDLTVPAPGEVKKVKPPVVRKKPIPGFQSLASATPHGHTLWFDGDQPRIEKPEFFIEYKSSDGYIDACPRWVLESLKKSHGNVGCLVKGKRELDKVKALNVPNVVDWLITQSETNLLNNPTILQFLSEDMFKAEDLCDEWHDFRDLTKIPGVLQHFKIPKTSLSETEAIHLRYYKDFLIHQRSDKLQKLRDILDNVPLHPSLVALAKKVDASILLPIINLGRVHLILEGTDQTKKDQVLKIVLEALI